MEEREKIVFYTPEGALACGFDGALCMGASTGCLTTGNGL